MLIRIVTAILAFTRIMLSAGFVLSGTFYDNFAVAADRKLTNVNSREAITQFFSEGCGGPPCEIKVLGVREIPQENIARVDFVVSNLKLVIPKNDAVTAYAFGPGGGTRLWSGNATANFAHYNDGKWVLTRIVAPQGGSWSNINIVVEQQPASACTFLATQDGRKRGTVKPYKGDCKNGLAHGNGHITTFFTVAPNPKFAQDGHDEIREYVGEFQNGKINGKGKLKSTRRPKDDNAPIVTHEGDFRDNLFQTGYVLSYYVESNRRYARRVVEQVEIAMCSSSTPNSPNCTGRLKELISQTSPPK